MFWMVLSRGELTSHPERPFAHSDPGLPRLFRINCIVRVLAPWYQGTSHPLDLRRRPRYGALVPSSSHTLWSSSLAASRTIRGGLRDASSVTAEQDIPSILTTAAHAQGVKCSRTALPFDIGALRRAYDSMFADVCALASRIQWLETSRQLEQSNESDPVHTLIREASIVLPDCSLVYSLAIDFTWQKISAQEAVDGTIHILQQVRTLR